MASSMIQISDGNWVIQMNVNDLRALTMNPHFYALLIRSFLSGYEAPCKIELVFMVIPIIVHSDTRKPLATASSKSRFETLYGHLRNKDTRLSGNALFAGFTERYLTLLPYSKIAVIILSSEKLITLNSDTIVAYQTIDYSTYSKPTRTWLRSTFYLGKVMRNTNFETVLNYCGVEM